MAAAAVPGADPLIAEAKERARHRRLVALGLVAVAAAAALGITLGTRSSPQQSALAELRAAVRDQVQVSQFTMSGPAIGAVDAHDYSGWLTTDGGRTWRRLPRRLDVVYPDFVNRRDGWMSASPSGLERTIDGGRTWERLTLPISAYQASLSRRPSLMNEALVSRTIGFVDVEPVGRGGSSAGRLERFSTHDGGLTWQARRNPGESDLWHFASARQGFALSDPWGNHRRALYSTVDGGRTWGVLLRLPHGCENPGVVSPLVGRTLVVPCTGLSLEPWSFYVSRDYGATWSARSDPRLSGAGTVSVVSARTWMVATSSGVYVTESAGRTWRFVRPLDLPRHWKIVNGQFASARTGWAIFERPVPGGGLPGQPPTLRVFMRTTDGGLHWTPAGPPKPSTDKRG